MVPTPLKPGQSGIPQSLSATALGLTSILLQVTILRRLLSLFAGNELIIGLTLGIWMALVGAGALIGHRFSRGNSFAWSFLVAALFAVPTVVVTYHIPGLLGLQPGETISFAVTAGTSVLTLLPLCLTLGAQFPLAARALGGDAARAYLLEAAGALVGGLLFTFLLSGRADSVVIAVAVSVLDILLSALLLRKTLLLPLTALPLVFSFAADHPTATASESGFQLVRRTESRYQEIAVYRNRDQMSVYAGGKMYYSYPDTAGEEMKIHPPLSLHRDPDSVLVVGGSPAVLREVLKYPVRTVYFVETDPALISTAREIFSDADRLSLADPRLMIVAADARRFLNSAGPARYDLVLLNLPEPSTANINRFYTVEFFREVLAALKPGGILCLQLQSADGYIGRNMQAAHGSVYSSLRTVFSYVKTATSSHGGVYASQKPIETQPALLSGRFIERNIATAFFSPLLFTDIFNRVNAEMVGSRLSSVIALNTDKRPQAYRYNLMLWSEIDGGWIARMITDITARQMVFAFLIAVAGCGALLPRRRHAFLYYSVFSTGYSAMALSVVVMLAYQAHFGSLYEDLALLSASFMAGSVAGVYCVRSGGKDAASMIVVEAAIVLILAASPLLLTVKSVYYGLVMVCGGIAGMQYALAARLVPDQKADRAAGRLYAADLAGSFSGGMLTSVFFVPLLGTTFAVLMLAALKSSSLFLLWSGHEKN